MLSKILNIVLVLLVVGLVGNYIYRMPKYDDGELAPEFTATLMNGSSFNLSDVKGKYVLLDFWGSWCAPCRRENPSVVSLKKSFGDKEFVDANGFEIISIAIETNEKSWKRAIAKDGLNWDHHIVQLDRFKSPIAKQYGIREIPTKYFIGPDGNIISVNDEFQNIASYLNEKLK